MWTLSRFLRATSSGLIAATVALSPVSATDPHSVAVGLDDFSSGRFAEAFETWSSAAATGDAQAALYIGVLYDTGEGVTQDYGEARAWYQQAAEEGNPIGAFNLGVIYDSGLGVAKDPQHAAAWYTRAAAGKFGRAYYNLGIMYELGVGVHKDRRRAVKLYKDAASHGILAAKDHLAALGQPYAVVITPPDTDAISIFQQAQRAIMKRDSNLMAKAAARFRASAENHDALAEYDLGYCYEREMGVQFDEKKALFWYRRAAADSTKDSLRSIAQAGADYVERLIQRER
jgi:TPR repeat protein